MSGSHELPPGWALARLPDVIGAHGLLSDGDWVESKDQDPTGEIRLTQLADIGDGTFRDRSARFMNVEKFEALNCTALEHGDVLVARMPDPLGRSCLFPALSQRCVTVVDVCIVRCGTRDVDQRWLMQSINAPDFRVAIADLQSGSTRKRISKKNLCTIPLPVPPSPEQGHIADAVDSYLSRLDDVVATLERVQRNLKRYRASVLKAAVEGRLVPTEAELARKEGRDYEPADVLLARILKERKARWIEQETEKSRAKAEAKAKKANKPWGKADDKAALEQARATATKKYKEPAPPDTTDLPELPEGWCWASPAQCFDWGSGDFLPKKAQCEGRVPVYGGNGINGYHDEALVDAPTIVIGRVGAQCGNIHLTEGAAWITDNAIFATLVSPNANLVFWRMVLGLQNLNARAGGTGQPYVNQKHINGLVVPFPPDVEQIRLVSEVDRLLSVAESTEETMTRNLRRSARTRQAILKWAFEGKLVDQDPNDEPASVLLERIRAEREAVEAKKSKTSKKTKATRRRKEKTA